MNAPTSTAKAASSTPASPASTPEKAVVQQMFDAFSRQSVVDALRTVSDDSIWIHHGTQKLPSLRFVGRNGVRQFFETGFSTMKVDYFRVLRLVQDGPMVIAFGEEQFRMQGQDGVLNQQWVQVYTVQNGLITRMEEWATSTLPDQYVTIA